MNKLILNIVLVSLLAACASQAPKEPVAQPQENNAAQAEADAAARAQAAADAAAVRAQAEADAAAAARAQAEADAAAALEKRSVYFPFDVDVVQDADKETILAHARNLAQNPDLKIRVEGNADERGSSEYNLGLGQRRAKNTRNALVLGGAKPSQIETVSYGEEKPRCTEHNESCWSQNRRADIGK